MRLLHTAAVAAILSLPALAQTQLVRGDVDTINGTNLFALKCTNIRLVSRTVNLRALHDRSRRQDIEYEMIVKDVSSGGQTVLDVLSAKQIPELFDMGNLRIGRSDHWHVLGAPGSVTAVFLTATTWTSYMPFGDLGTWLLGTTFAEVAQGTVGSFGRFQFSFQPPNLPHLIGQSFAAQAVVRNPAGVYSITNAQCKELRSR